MSHMGRRSHSYVRHDSFLVSIGEGDLLRRTGVPTTQYVMSRIECVILTKEISYVGLENSDPDNAISHVMHRNKLCCT